MMNCHYHPQEPAIGECRLCGTPICKECMTVVKGNVLCPDCVKQIEGGKRKEESQAQSPIQQTQQAKTEFEAKGTIEPRSKFLTFVLSFLPGLGHLYLGLTRQGIELMALFFGCIWMIPLLGAPFPFSFIIPILFFYSIFDALQKRDRIARGEPINPNATFFRNVNLDWFTKKQWIGWVIIAMGGLMLLKQMGAYYYFRGFDDVIVALILVGAGVWMLQRERKKSAYKSTVNHESNQQEPDKEDNQHA